MALDSGCSDCKLYKKEDLLKEYRQLTEKYEDTLCSMVKKTLVPFVSMRILSDQKRKDWTDEDNECGTEKRFSRLISEVLQSGSLDCFIKFTRALTFRNKMTDIKQVYPFAPHLFEVGLVDPLQAKSDVQLVPRNVGQGKPVVLFLVRDREKFERIKSLRPNTTPAQESGFKILSQYDKTAEARHITRLLQLCKSSESMKPAVCPRTIDYLSRVELCSRQATRYAAVRNASVHCSDAANLHYASKLSTIPAIAIARVISDQNNATSQEDFYYFVNDIVKYML